MKTKLLLIYLILCTAGFHCKNNSNIGGFPRNAVKLDVKYSKLFQLAVYKSDTFLILTDPADSSHNIGKYVWGAGNSQFSGFTRLKPIKSLVVLSAVFVGMIESLHGQGAIKAVDNGEFISSPKTSKLIGSGKIVSVSGNGNHNKEAIHRLKPDAILAYYIDIKGKEDLDYLVSKGIPVIYLQNYLEPHPLGRAEWLKIIGALLGKYGQATAMFDEIEEHYLSTVERVKDQRKPTVLINAPFSGVWDIPAGNSYMVKLVEDAGGEYVFKHNKGTGRIPMGIEKVYQKGQYAEFWINPGACQDTQCLMLMDKRLGMFNAYKKKQVYNCTKLINPNGSNPWWDYGIMRPDLVLLDLYTILHPATAGEHELVFFEKI